MSLNIRKLQLEFAVKFLNSTKPLKVSEFSPQAQALGQHNNSWIFHKIENFGYFCQDFGIFSCYTIIFSPFSTSGVLSIRNRIYVTIPSQQNNPDTKIVFYHGEILFSKQIIGRFFLKKLKILEKLKFSKMLKISKKSKILTFSKNSTFSKFSKFSIFF